MVNRFAEIDEHYQKRRFETRFAPLSVEERSYLAQQAVREGRIAEVEAELDYRDNVKLMGAAKLTLAGAAVVFAVAFAALVWVVK